MEQSVGSSFPVPQGPRESSPAEASALPPAPLSSEPAHVAEDVVARTRDAYQETTVLSKAIQQAQVEHVDAQRALAKAGKQLAAIKASAESAHQHLSELTVTPLGQEVLANRSKWLGGLIHWVKSFRGDYEEVARSIQQVEHHLEKQQRAAKSLVASQEMALSKVKAVEQKLDTLRGRLTRVNPDAVEESNVERAARRAF